MRKGWLYATGLVCLMAACTGTPQSSADGLCSIDVAGAMVKPAELKLSELGSDVRYVLLETTDSCLIGGNPNILLLDKQIAVVSGKNCFLFDKETGKFLTKVGHVGEDPEAYSGPAPTYNDVDGLLYFMRRPATLQKYDMQGKYRGKLTIPTPPASPGDFCFTDSLVIGHYNNLAMGYNARSLLFFNEAGEQVDTVPSLFPVLPEKGVQDIASISVIKQGNAGIVLSNFKDGENSASITGIDPSLYEAAVMDGATKKQQMRHITLPGIKPVFIMMLILDCGKIFNSDFGLFYQVTGGIPQSLYTTVSTFDTYVYNAIQSTAPIGQTAAASFFQAICSCGMILLANWVVSKLDNENRII